jgi:N-glycosylase/DNA lyase
MGDIIHDKACPPMAERQRIINEKDVKAALAQYNTSHSPEAPASLSSAKGRVLEVKFGGHTCFSCCAFDYFDDLAIELERFAGAPFAAFDSAAIAKPTPHYLVKYAMLDFLDEIKCAMAEVGEEVCARIAEFENASRDERTLFSELCYCILTANYTAEGGMRIQREIGDGFARLPKEEVAKKLRELHYRFPNIRASFIVEARRLNGDLLQILKGFSSSVSARAWLVENVKGYGFKEASHFMRNVGFKDVAIIDRHIVRFLDQKELLSHAESKKAILPRRYLQYERILAAIARRLSINLAELDLYIWYLMTGKVLK